MPRTMHRTAILTIHNPTRHARAVLERVFRQYTAAYTACLHACERHYDAPMLLGLATFALDATTNQPRRNARTLSKRWFSAETAPAVARVYTATAAPLESHLRQSLREHIAQTLYSYALRQQEWSRLGATSAGSSAASCAANGEDHGSADSEAPRHATAKATREPRFPGRLRLSDHTPTMRTALEGLAQLADHPLRERELRAQLQRTRQAETVAIPFVGVAAEYGCGLYLNRETNRFYTRLDIVGSSSHLGRPITARGRYVDLKTGVVTVSAGSEDQRALPEAASFGRGRKSILVPLEMGRWHEEAQRWSVTPCASGAAPLPVAYLPQRGADPRHPAAATPVSARLVRHADPKRAGGYRYELHVAFRMPAPEPQSVVAPDARPLLAINRGMRHLYVAVVTTPDASRALDVQVASGKELLEVQQAHERARAERQRHGVASAQARAARPSPARDRRLQRIGDHHCDAAANEIVALAQRHGAQVVLEDFTRIMDGQIPYLLRPIIHRRQFEKLAKRLDERLEVVGLPPARQIGAYHISLDCPRCGRRQEARAVARSGRPGLFVCAHCGETQDRDVSAAANVARRFVWLRQRGVEKREGTVSEQRTTWEAFATTHPVNDLRSPADATTSAPESAPESAPVE